MYIEQSVGSYPTPRRTVTADISPRSEGFSGSVIVWPAVDIAVDSDLSGFPVLVGVNELLTYFESAPATPLTRSVIIFTFVIKEMIGLVSTRLRTTNQLFNYHKLLTLS